MGKIKVASLFSGCGGMDFGMVGGFKYLNKKYPKHPVEIIYALDNDKYACSIFNENFSIRCTEGDIREIEASEIPPHHLLTGGFPCQSFSIVAQNPRRLGYKDEEGRLFFEMCRIIRERKPTCFIAENVKGILSANRGKAFPLILKEFENSSYHITYDLLNASDYGVPQKRERVFIIGFKDRKILDNFKFPEKTTPKQKVPLSLAILSDNDVPEKYFFSEKAVEGLKRGKKEMNKGRVQDLAQPCNTIGAHLTKVSLNSTDPVLKTNGRYRRFTPREAANIQSFPNNFKLVGSDGKQYRAIGNAVPPVLMWHVTNSVINAILLTDKKIINSVPYRTDKEKKSYHRKESNRTLSDWEGQKT